jgi:hypothetical protein
MAKGRGYYNDDEYSDDEMYEMQVHAMERNRQQDYSIIESVQLSTEYVERKTGFGLTPEDVATSTPYRSYERHSGTLKSVWTPTQDRFVSRLR